MLSFGSLRCRFNVKYAIVLEVSIFTSDMLFGDYIVTFCNVRILFWMFTLSHDSKKNCH